MCLRRKNDWDTLYSEREWCRRPIIVINNWRRCGVPSALIISMHVADESTSSMWVRPVAAARDTAEKDGGVTTADDHLYEMSVVTQIRFRRDQLRRRHRLVANGSSTGWWSRCRQSGPASNQWGDEPTPRDTAVVERPAAGDQQRRLGDWVGRRGAGQPDGGGPCVRWLMLLTVSCSATVTTCR